jgi:FMN phosphatase YigB (HAD superfamily)
MAKCYQKLNLKIIMRTKAILFDLYGTLISRQERHFLKQVSHYHIRQLLEGRTVSKLGTLVLHLKQKLMTTDLSTQAIPHELLSMFSFSSDEQLSDIECEFRNALLTDSRTTHLFSGVKTILSFFKRQGYALGVVSNVSTYHKEPFFRLGLDRFVDVVVFSCDVGYAKPHPEMYLNACKQLEVKPDEVVFVGDSYNMDVKMPLSLGMKAIHVSLSRRHRDTIDNITEMGLMILDDDIYNIKYLINDTKPVADRKVILQTFTLLEDQNDQESITYSCSGSHYGEERRFYLKRYFDPSSLYSRQVEYDHVNERGDKFSIPITIGSEFFLLISKE